MSLKVCFVVKNIRYAEDVAGANCLPVIAEEDYEDYLRDYGIILIADRCYYERNFVFPEQDPDDAFGLGEEELDHLIRSLVSTQTHEGMMGFRRKETHIGENYNMTSYDEVDIISTEEYEAMLARAAINDQHFPELRRNGYVGDDGVLRWAADDYAVPSNA